MRKSRPILLASLLLGAACTGDVTAPGGPTIAGSPATPSVSPFGTSTAPAESDSVIAGYGCPATGGLEYENFEYDPDTGTEYCATSDTTPPPPPPPPPPPQDTVQSGYGSGSTGGIEYETFEYEPETGTEYVATSDDRDSDN